MQSTRISCLVIVNDVRGKISTSEPYFPRRHAPFSDDIGIYQVTYALTLKMAPHDILTIVEEQDIIKSLGSSCLFAVVSSASSADRRDLCN